MHGECFPVGLHTVYLHCLCHEVVVVEVSEHLFVEHKLRFALPVGAASPT